MPRGKVRAMTLSCGQLLAWTFEFLFPTQCTACGAAGGPFCPRCTAALASAPALHRGSTDGVPPVVALGSYEGTLRTAVLALKFRGAKTAGAYLGPWLAPKIIFPFEVVVPVPLHAARQCERGYNQAAEFARGIAGASRRPYVEDALIRVRANSPQSALDSASRSQNVHGAFAAGPGAPQIARMRVLLVDDVVTTGATARACSTALLAAGASTIYFAAAAIRL